MIADWLIADYRTDAMTNAAIILFFVGIALNLLYRFGKRVNRKNTLSVATESSQTRERKHFERIHAGVPAGSQDSQSIPSNEKIKAHLVHPQEVTPTQYMYSPNFAEKIKDNDSGDVPHVGFVYLLKAGPFYKIGKSKDPEKRVRQIKLQLPYDVEVVHVVASSNMDYLETHWHKRFADKRANGEWFLLTEEDVASFLNQ